MKIIGTLLKIFAGVVTLGVSCGDLNAQQGGLQSMTLFAWRGDRQAGTQQRQIEKIAGGHKWIEGRYGIERRFPALLRQSS